MPRNRKYFINRTPVLVSSRVEEGLPMPATHVMNFIIWGILARAHSLYRVKICHFVFMANHFHMLLVVDDPEDVPRFVGYLKAEIAQAINRLLGRRQRTIWTEGYDSPTLLTSDDVLRYIAYIYLNPARANLVKSIKEYPGVSSWRMFVSRVSKAKHKHLSRDSIPALKLPTMPVGEQNLLVHRFRNSPGTIEVFELEPFAWMECFPDCGDEEEVRERIFEMVQLEEAELGERDVIGATVLRRQSMIKVHQPKKFQRKMVCISSDVERRKTFIEHFKLLCEEARQVYQRWREGEVAVLIPAGLFAPAMPVLVNELMEFT